MSDSEVPHDKAKVSFFARTAGSSWALSHIVLKCLGKTDTQPYSLRMEAVCSLVTVSMLEDMMGVPFH
jgi:hypothetical protein